MNTVDYDQISLQRDALDAADLLKEGEIVTIMFNTEDSMPLSVDMPASVVLEVTHSEPGVKGNTATNATKPAIIETGARINVPLFINEGDKIKIDTEKGTYMERVKEVDEVSRCTFCAFHSQRIQLLYKRRRNPYINGNQRNSQCQRR